MVFGDNVFLTRRVVEPALATDDRLRRAGRHHQPALPDALRHAAVQPHRPARTPAASATRGADTSGLLLVNGVCAALPRPGQPSAHRHAPVVGRVPASTSTTTSLSHEFHSFDVQLSVTTRRSDAKGARQLRQRLPRRQPGARPDLRPARQRRDPGRRRHRSSPSPASSATSARRARPTAAPGTPGVNLVVRLRRRPRYRPVVRGGHRRRGLHRRQRRQRHRLRRPRPGRHRRRQLRLLQPDIRPTTPPVAADAGGADLRPDGSDLIFGGAGTRQRPQRRLRPGHRPTLRSTTATPTRSSATTATSSASSASNGVDGLRRTPTPNAVRHLQLRQLRRRMRTQIVVRGVTLLDYTPGGPDFDARRCSASAAEPRTVQRCRRAPRATAARRSRPARRNGTRVKYVDIGGSDEVHGERGDDTVYTGARQRHRSSATPRTTT